MFHNNKDLETIKNLNHDDIKILTPGGEFNNSEDHIEFLKGGLQIIIQTGLIYYMIGNKLTENDTLKQYVTSCHELTLTIDSNQVKVSQIMTLDC